MNAVLWKILKSAMISAGSVGLVWLLDMIPGLISAQLTPEQYAMISGTLATIIASIRALIVTPKK